MDTLSERFFNELCNLAYWQKSYERILTTEKYSAETIDYIYNLMETGKYKNVAKELATGKYKFATPEKRLIAKAESKKKRVIYCYPEKDRFIMSLLYRVTSHIFESKIHPTCFSYKVGVNTAMAVKSIQKAKGKYGIKLDIHAYFNSVNREYLYSCINELFPTDASVRKVFEQLFMNDAVLVKGELVQEYKSLIPGSALGSFFANYCLRDIDQYFADNNIVYARYSDDIIFFTETEEETKGYFETLLKKIEDRGLTVNEDKFKMFGPEDDIEYLGLRFEKDMIDISRHAKQKLKKTIKRWCKKGRKAMEMSNQAFMPTAKNIVNRFNWRLYKTYIEDTTKFGWAYYAFRYITVETSLRELDEYCKDTIRAMKTGRHNKRNKFAVSEEEFEEMGYVSFCEMYRLFKTDFDYYCDVIARI